MSKIITFLLLFLIFIIYSFVVYTKGTESNISNSLIDQSSIKKGKLLFQKHNCIACHQLYGLGGYLGPELTNAWSDQNRGEVYMKAFLQKGTIRMPNFNLKEEEINSILSFLHYVDSSAVTYKTKIP